MSRWLDEEEEEEKRWVAQIAQIYQNQLSTAATPPITAGSIQADVIRADKISVTGKSAKTLHERMQDVLSKHDAKAHYVDIRASLSRELINLIERHRARDAEEFIRRILAGGGEE